jgi:hypothetical protein
MRTEFEEFEETVGASLRARADRPVDTHALHEGALARGRSLRRRRRLLASAVSGAAVAAAVAAVAVAPRLAPVDHRADRGIDRGRPDATTNAPAKEMRNAGPTTLPPARAWPAADKPDVVGTDPGTVHFDLDLAALKATGSEWNTRDGYEWAAIFTGKGDHYGLTWNAYLSPSPDTLNQHLWGGYPVVFDGKGQPQPPPSGQAPEPITVNGRPGTIQRFRGGASPVLPDGIVPLDTTLVLRWQPVDGLWAGVEGHDSDQAVLAVAGALRLDRAQRCVVPVRAAVVPAGAHWSGCSVQVSPADGMQGVWVGSALWFSRPEGGTLIASLQDRIHYNGVNPGDFKATDTVAGKPAMWEGRLGQLWVPAFADRFYLQLEVSGTGFTKADAIAVGNGLAYSGDLARPETWPERAVG